MHTEYLLVNDGRNWQAIKAVGEDLPKLYVVSTFAFIVEPVDAIDGSTLVVATKNEKNFLGI